MTGRISGSEPDGEPLARPFLTGGIRVRVAPDAPAATRPADQVRPYLLTGGRTAPHGTTVAMETVVLATGTPLPAFSGPAAGELARILHACARPCSAAEVAARLSLPLQVAVVLVSDLVAGGLLDATGAGAGQSGDVPFLERLIAGVAAL